MILFVDDELRRTRRWRQAVESNGWRVHAVASAAEALDAFRDRATMKQVELVVLDLDLATTGDLTEGETGLGRLTGDALRRRLRDGGWMGPVIVLTNSRDEDVKVRIDAEGDLCLRKPDCLPSTFVGVVRGILGPKDER